MQRAHYLGARGPADGIKTVLWLLCAALRRCLVILAGWQCLLWWAPVRRVLRSPLRPARWPLPGCRRRGWCWSTVARSRGTGVGAKGIPAACCRWGGSGSPAGRCAAGGRARCLPSGVLLVAHVGGQVVIGLRPGVGQCRRGVVVFQVGA